MTMPKMVCQCVLIIDVTFLSGGIDT